MSHTLHLMEVTLLLCRHHSESSQAVIILAYHHCT